MLEFLFITILYIIMAGATHGYAKHRWPQKITKVLRTITSTYENVDENSSSRVAATILWPFYWAFIWPFTIVNEVTFNTIEKRAAHKVARNRSRIADLHATRVELEKSNAELEQAELELEKEIKV